MTDRRFRPAAARETGDDDPDVRELMTHRLVGIAHNADADVALRLLGSAAVRHLAVMDGSCCLAWYSNMTCSPTSLGNHCIPGCI
jgi:hypothetical protein